jgi:hypothetical protein
VVTAEAARGRSHKNQREIRITDLSRVGPFED